jgi:hypothetical protein
MRRTEWTIAVSIGLLLLLGGGAEVSADPSASVGLPGDCSLTLGGFADRDPVGLAVDQALSAGDGALLAEATAGTEPSHTGPAVPPAARPNRRWGGNPGQYFSGAFVGLLSHETGHLIANYAQDTDPFLMSVHYGFIPFFTIEPGRHLTNHEHYLTSSAGFNAQHLVNEWLLVKHPHLSDEDEPFLRGLATFNFWLTMGYAATAFARTGPNERDTKGMADSLGWNETYVGLLILAPTILDTYRYKHPDCKWARTASRLSKLLVIGLAAKAH